MRKTVFITLVLMIIAFAAIPMAVSAQDLEEPPIDPLAADAANIAINIVWLIIAIAIAVYMYKDAEARGKSGIVWGIIGFCCTCVGLIIWLLVRPPIPQAPPPGYYPPPGQQPYYPPPQQPGYPPQQGQYPPPQQPPPY